VWLLNSEDEGVYFWELADGQWTKVRWGIGHDKRIGRELSPPPELYPKLVR